MIKTIKVAGEARPRPHGALRGRPRSSWTRPRGGARARRARRSRGTLARRAVARAAGSSSPPASPRTTWRRPSAWSGPFAVDVNSGVEAAPGPQGPGEGAPLRRRGRVAAAESPRASRRRACDPAALPDATGSLRPLRRTLRARDADGAADRARARLPRGAARPALPSRASATLLTNYAGPPDPALLRGAADRATRAARASTSSARTSATPAPTRSTTCSARRCSPQRMGKRRIIAETGAGQHGVASATAAALLGLDVRGLHGQRGHRAPGARTCSACGSSAPRVIPVESGSRTLKDAVNEALRDWVTNVRTTYYLLGSVDGPAPVPHDGARLPARDRRGGARASPGRRSAGCPTCSWRAWAGARTPSASSGPSSRTRRVRIVGVEPGGHGVAQRQARRLARRGRGGRAPRQHELRAPERRRPDRRRRTRSPPASTTRAWARSTRTTRTWGASSTHSVTDARGARGLPGAHPARGPHARARVSPRRGLRHRRGRAG